LFLHHLKGRKINSGSETERKRIVLDFQKKTKMGINKIKKDSEDLRMGFNLDSLLENSCLSLLFSSIVGNLSENKVVFVFSMDLDSDDFLGREEIVYNRLSRLDVTGLFFKGMSWELDMETILVLVLSLIPLTLRVLKCCFNWYLNYEMAVGKWGK